MMNPPDVSVHSRLLTQRRYRSTPRDVTVRRQRARRGHSPAIVALVALVLTVALERLIYLQIDDHLAAVMLALIVALIVIVAIAPSPRSRKP